LIYKGCSNIAAEGVCFRRQTAARACAQVLDFIEMDHWHASCIYSRMKFIAPSSLRVSRRLRRFNASLIAALAAMALTACDAGPQRMLPATSIARGVQQILQSSGQSPLISSQPTTGKQS
jgi:hypothetical protein